MSERFYEDTEIAKYYQRYRTDYSGSDIEKEILPFLREKLKEASDSCAVDVGCGSGQLTRVLAPHFNKVIGIDCSQAQINVAQEVNSQGNVEYRVGLAEDMSFLTDQSIDLVTVAGALHFFKGVLFNAEVDRVLKPGGCFLIVLFGYNTKKPYTIIPATNREDVIKQCSDLMDDLTSFVLQYHSPKVKVVMSTGNFVIPRYQETRCFEKIITKPLESVDDFFGFLKSVGPVVKYQKENPDKEDKAEVFNRRLQQILNAIPPSPEPIELSLGLYIKCFLYRKPNTKEME